MKPLTWLLKIILSLFTSRQKKIYGLDHAILNIQIPPESMWMNMGYWEHESTLQKASQALLDQVLITAGLINQPGTPKSHPPHLRFRLIDLGIGCGDQSVYLNRVKRSTQGQEQPLFDSYVGLTIASSQAEFARKRVESAAPDYPTSIFCADAANPESWDEEIRKAVNENGDGVVSAAQQTWVLALDTLYHFRPSREPILKHTYSLQASFMAFDLVLPDSASLWQRLLLRLICLLTGTPYSNFLTWSQYEDLLVSAGYEPERIIAKDISPYVFSGIAEYIQQRDRELKRFGMGVGKFKGAGWVFGWWARSGVVRGMVVIARRSDVL